MMYLRWFWVSRHPAAKETRASMVAMRCLLMDETKQVERAIAALGDKKAIE